MMDTSKEINRLTKLLSTWQFQAIFLQEHMLVEGNRSVTMKVKTSYHYPWFSFHNYMRISVHKIICWSFLFNSYRAVLKVLVHLMLLLGGFETTTREQIHPINLELSFFSILIFLVLQFYYWCWIHLFNPMADFSRLQEILHNRVCKK